MSTGEWQKSVFLVRWRTEHTTASARTASEVKAQRRTSRPSCSRIEIRISGAPFSSQSLGKAAIEVGSRVGHNVGVPIMLEERKGADADAEGLFGRELSGVYATMQLSARVFQRRRLWEEPWTRREDQGAKGTCED